MTLPDWLLEILQSHWLPLIIFMGAFGDAFIVSSLFVFGEFFFIGAGYGIAQDNHWWLLPVTWAGAFLGDCASYSIGRHYGSDAIRKFTHRRAKWRLNFMRARRLLKRKGALTIFTARLAGPVSKLTPFIAGTLHMPVLPFTLASLAGVIAGTAQFIFAGWLLGKGLDNRHLISDFFHAHPWSVVVLGMFVVAGVFLLLTRRTRST